MSHSRRTNPARPERRSGGHEHDFPPQYHTPGQPQPPRPTIKPSPEEKKPMRDAAKSNRQDEEGITMHSA